jgi:hypothetical protein
MPPDFYFFFYSKDAMDRNNGATLQIYFEQHLRDAGPASVYLEIVNPKSHQLVFSGAVNLWQENSVGVTPHTTYVVRLLLPSGEVITRQVESGRPGEEKLVSLETTDPSPREYLAYAYVLRGVPKPVAEDITTIRGRPRVRLTIWECSGLESPNIFGDLSQPSRYNWNLLNASDAQRMIAEDDRVEDLRVLRSLVYNPTRIPDIPPKTVWVQTANPGGGPRFTALPHNSKVRLLFAGPSDDYNTSPDSNVLPTHILPDGGASDSEALLGYLAVGNTTAAREVVRSFDFSLPPISSEVEWYRQVVLGYALLKVGPEESFIHSWFSNLENQNMLPDAAVVSAWYALNILSNNPDPLEGYFRNTLLLAASRGIPRFTEGLRLLYTGLQMLNRRYGGDDMSVQNALTLVQRYAVIADPRMVNTTLYMSDFDGY